MVAETSHTVVEGGMKISHAIDFQTTVKSRAVDQSTIQFQTRWAKGDSL